MKEKEIQRAIIEYLQWQKIFCWKQNNAGIQKPDGHFIPSGMRGVPDILCIIQGRFVGIEVKVEGRYQSPAQREFQQRCENAGGIYLLVHSVDEVEKAIRKL